MLKLEFTGNNADELNEQVKDYASKIKGTRGGATAPLQPPAGGATAPLQPPAGGAASGFPGGGQTGFAPPAGGATQAGAGPFAAGAQLAPEVQALVNRISVRIDGAIGSGQPAQGVLDWFKGECAKNGLDASAATLDQIKTVFVPKLSQPALEAIAKLMNA